MEITLVRDKNIVSNLQFMYSQLTETRNRLMELLDTIPDRILDMTPDRDRIESIATLLDHIAAVEWSWIFEDIFDRDMDLKTWQYGFPFRKFTDVSQRTGMGKKYYIDRLNAVRNDVYHEIIRLNEKDRERLVGKERKYSIEWILYHLNHHEALHHGQIAILKKKFDN